MEKETQETVNNEDDIYFEDMVDDTPELSFRGYGLGVPKTRFTERGLWG